jgi:4-hydroxy-tetrahydrodipicolinate reductase
MKVALVGCGKMGRAVEELARARGLEVVARFGRARPLTGGMDATLTGGMHAKVAGGTNAELVHGAHAPLASAINPALGGGSLASESVLPAGTHEAPASGPVLIDFSVPEAVLATVRAAAELSLPLVIGTTGWQEQRAAVREIAERAGIGVVWAANFSLGVHFFYRLVERAAALLAPLAPLGPLASGPGAESADGYDPFIVDWHHRFKLDSPSGTAIEIQRRMAPAYGGRQVPITSLRAGAIPSAHAAGFDSAADTIHLEHRARNRQGLAEGALLAASWVCGRRGFHEFGEVLDDLLAAA